MTAQEARKLNETPLDSSLEEIFSYIKIKASIQTYGKIIDRIYWYGYLTSEQIKRLEDLGYQVDFNPYDYESIEGKYIIKW